MNRKHIPLVSIAFPVILGAAFGASFLTFLLEPPNVPAIDQWVGLLTPVAGAVLIVLQIMQSRELAKVKQVAVATHTLSNSATGAMLQASLDDAIAASIQAHKLAELTKDAGYIAAAAAADVKVTQRRMLLQNHQVQQAKVDAQLPQSALS
jgi:hypothetical protein